MDDLAELRAEMLAYRFALETLWANFLRHTPDPIGTCRRVAEESSAALDACYEQRDVGPQAHDTLQIMLSHHESLWKSIEQQLRLQPGRTAG